MQVHNVDESGINLIQHKGVSLVGRINVHRVVALEKRKNHTCHNFVLYLNLMVQFFYSANPFCNAYTTNTGRTL